MSVDIEQLTMPDFLALLRYEGNPPPGPEFDAIRMTSSEWQAMFPGAPRHEQGGEVDVGHSQPAAAPV